MQSFTSLNQDWKLKKKKNEFLLYFLKLPYVKTEKS